MENSSKLNSLDHYSQLISLSKRIGYEISKVVFRGYHTSSQLQRLHDQVHPTTNYTFIHMNTYHSPSTWTPTPTQTHTQLLMTRLLRKDQH